MENFVKYGPLQVHNGIANLFDNMTMNGECPKQIKQGILKALQKPREKGKAREETGRGKSPTKSLRQNEMCDKQPSTKSKEELCG